MKTMYPAHHDLIIILYFSLQIAIWQFLVPPTHYGQLVNFQSCPNLIPSPFGKSLDHINISKYKYIYDWDVCRYAMAPPQLSANAPVFKILNPMIPICNKLTWIYFQLSIFYYVNHSLAYSLAIHIPLRFEQWLHYVFAALAYPY